MAARAIDGARHAATPESRTTYLELARSWKALADAVERFASDGVAELPPGGDSKYFQ